MTTLSDLQVYEYRLIGCPSLVLLAPDTDLIDVEKSLRERFGGKFIEVQVRQQSACTTGAPTDRQRAHRNENAQPAEFSDEPINPKNRDPDFIGRKQRG